MGGSPNKSIKKIDKSDIIPEEHINGRPESLSKNQITKILEQMENSVCKIIKEKSTGTGFICIIPFPDKLYPLPVLITCYHVLSEKDLQIGKKIKLLIGGEEKLLKINNQRKIYTNEEYDISIIELKTKDNLISNELLEIDNEIFKDQKLDKKFSNKSIYIIHYPEGKEGNYSLDVIKHIDEDNILIQHQCSTKDGSSGGPIFNLQTFNVIGIHRGKHKKSNFNLGTILTIPIKEFYEKFKNNLNKINDEDDMSKNSIKTSTSSNSTNLKNKSDTKNIKQKQKEMETDKGENSLIIEILENYICKITYKLNNNDIKDIGFLVRISNYPIKGLLTNYQIEEKNLYEISTIVIFYNKKIYKYDINNIFIFSDKFLNSTFIELEKFEYEYIEIKEERKNIDIPLLIKYSEENNTFNYIEAKIKGKWGINIFYEEEKNYYDCDSVSSKLALITDDGLIGVHKHIDYNYNIAVNVETIVKALLLNYSNFKNNVISFEEEGISLNKSQIKELNEHGLEFTNIANVLISLPTIFVTPIWFYRTKHAWYWTPTKPHINDLNKVNWMIIFPNNSLQVIGGEWDGIEPAENNIEIIKWLETTKLKYNNVITDNE